MCIKQTIAQRLFAFIADHGSVGKLWTDFISECEGKGHLERVQEEKLEISQLRGEHQDPPERAETNQRIARKE